MLNVFKTTEFAGPATRTQLTSYMLDAGGRLVDRNSLKAIFQNTVDAQLVPKGAEGLNERSEAVLHRN